MSRRRRWSIIVAAGLVGLALWWLRNDHAPRSADTSLNIKNAQPGGVRPIISKEAHEKLLRDSVEAHLADDLNLPGGTIRSDLAMVGSMIAAYRSIYHARGNPIGDNREITDTFLGRNPNGIIFLPAGHRAINARGELCDRWGTPFHFHAESGRKMEIRSAGPDRKMWNADDIAIVP